jgi:hypothetical protein
MMEFLKSLGTKERRVFLSKRMALKHKPFTPYKIFNTFRVKIENPKKLTCTNHMCILCNKKYDVFSLARDGLHGLTIENCDKIQEITLPPLRSLEVDNCPNLHTSIRQTFFHTKSVKMKTPGNNT